MVGRDRAMLDTFVELTDSLVNDYELNEFLLTLVERCGGIFEVTTVGVMLESAAGHLQLAVALTSEMEALEQAEIDNADGPCHEAYRTGKAVVVNDLDDSDAAQRWPTVIERIQAMGHRSVYAFPIRLRDDRIGALNLYRDITGAFADDDVRLAQAFADVAAIGILQERKVTGAERRAEQLQHALASRVMIEQAKGVISARLGVSVDEAFELIRRYARNNNRKVHDVARSVIDEGTAAIQA